MKKLFFAAIIALIALSFGAAGSQAQAASGFSGKAVRWNGAAIVGATISLLTGPLETDKEIARTITSADGSWSIQAPAGGPYWVHIHTFGEWWGYSYQTPFTLQTGEQISQLFLALGPRDVQEIVLPTPTSNVGPSIGEEDATPTPISNVMPGIGYGDDEGEAPGMPRTGDAGRIDGTLFMVLAAAVFLLGSGLSARVLSRRS